MSIIERLKAKALRWAKPLPFQGRHVVYSTISSIDDQPGSPNKHLLDTSMAAILAAQEINLGHISPRMRAAPTIQRRGQENATASWPDS